MNETPLPGSALADSAAAALAVDLVMPMIHAGMADCRFGASGFLHLVIMDPGRLPIHCRFEEAILHEHSYGDTSAWDADYALYAREKARVCWEHQRNGHEIRSCSPQLLRGHETGVWGGVWFDGIVVGVSGADPWFDEAVATAVAAMLRAVAKQRGHARPECLWISDGFHGAAATRA